MTGFLDPFTMYSMSDEIMVESAPFFHSFKFPPPKPGQSKADQLMEFYAIVSMLAPLHPGQPSIMAQLILGEDKYNAVGLGEWKLPPGFVEPPATPAEAPAGPEDHSSAEQGASSDGGEVPPPDSPNSPARTNARHKRPASGVLHSASIPVTVVETPSAAPPAVQTTSPTTAAGNVLTQLVNYAPWALRIDPVGLGWNPWTGTGYKPWGLSRRTPSHAAPVPTASGYRQTTASRQG